MRKRYGSGVAAIVLAAFVVLSSITTVQAQVGQKPPVYYPTLSLRHWEGSTDRWDGTQRVPGPNGAGIRYFLVPVYVYNEVDTSFNWTVPGQTSPNMTSVMNGGQHVYGQHLEPIRSFSFQLYYSAKGFVLDTTQGNPVVMVGPGPLDTGRAKTFFTRFSDQIVPAGSPNGPQNANPDLHVIRVAGAGSVPLWNSPPTGAPDSRDTTVLLWLRFRVLGNGLGSNLFLDSARFNDHPGDSLLWQGHTLSGLAPTYNSSYFYGVSGYPLNYTVNSTVVSATESAVALPGGGYTVTMTTSTPHGLTVDQIGQEVVVSGFGSTFAADSGYNSIIDPAKNGVYVSRVLRISGVQSATTFTYTNPTGGMNPSSGGSISVTISVHYDWTHGNLGGNLNTISPPWPGQGYVAITDQPAFEILEPSKVHALDNNPFPANWQLVNNMVPGQDLVYDPANPQATSETLFVRDNSQLSTTELDNVNICSDQYWLKIALGGGGGLQCQYIPKLIFDNGTPVNKQFSLIVDNNDPKVKSMPAGIYYATVTFTGDGAVNSPCKLYVKYFKFANPDEPKAGAGTGIRLSITSSCIPPVPLPSGHNPLADINTTTLAFGTGTGASEALDLLYGERVVNMQDTINADVLHDCFAWFRPQNLAVDPQYQAANFVGISRDIRSPNTDTTLIYEVQFMTGGSNCYPIKVCVNPNNDFPQTDGSRVLLAFTLNGGAQPIDLRNATPDGSGNMCVTITDHTIDHFYILYTPGLITSLATFLKTYSWNLISLPVNPPNPDPKIIFSNAAGVPWEYSSFSSWSAASSLEFGRGYMLRYGNYIGTNGIVAGTLSPAGINVKSIDNVKIDEGWNSVGAASYPCPADNAHIMPEPPIGSTRSAPNLVGDVWEFDPHNGYTTTAFLVPGRGYFIKVDASGIYTLQNVIPPPPHGMATQTSGAGKVAESLTGQLSNVLINDAEGNGQMLYFGQATTSVPESHFEMPGQFQSFDARFASNSGMMSYNHSNYTVNVQATSYPVTMKFSNVAGTVEVRDVKGAIIGTANGSGFVTISDPSVKQVTIVEKQSGAAVPNGMSYRLDQNTPNPFAPVTTIRYATPQQEAVSLVVYNELGEIVQTLVSGVLGAGEHEALFDASNLPAGVYFYTLKAGSFVQTQRMTLGK